MSMCAGKIYCEMFRDKKYCRKAPERENYNKECVCRHARKLCEVETCHFEELCKASVSLKDILAERKKK